MKRMWTYHRSEEPSVGPWSRAWLTRAAALVALVTAPIPATAQGGPGTENGEWRYLGGDAWHTRYSPLDQIDAGNFEELGVAWIWRGDNFGPNPVGNSRSTPIYADGILYTVAGSRRTVVAMNPATGETALGVP